MDRNWYTRFLVVAGVIALAAYALYPSYHFYYQATEEERASHEKFCDGLPSVFMCKKFSLGLDLQGGVHLVMGVGVEKAVEQRVDRLVDSLRDSLKDKSLAFTRLTRPRNETHIELALVEGADIGEFTLLLKRDFSILEIKRREGNTFKLMLLEPEAEFVRTTAVDQTIKTIRNRADKFGVAEPTIARRGKTNILIQLPGVKDPKRAISMIGKTAQLEFKIVQEAPTEAFDGIDADTLPEGVVRREASFDGPKGPLREVYFEVPEQHREAMIGILEPIVGEQNELAFEDITAEGVSQKLLRTYVLDSVPGITGDYLTNAQVQQNPDIPSDYYVTMTFDAKGANIFAKLTEVNARRRMAIVLDSKVNSAPRIEGRIAGGSARITLGGVGNAREIYEQANDLALVLKAGALPAPVEIREKRQVGKTLGKQSVERGTWAILVGTILVILFMFMYYRGSGVIANVALTLNVVLVLALLAVFEATLTLPGMAGIVLTIGMAVDANVIIFERIREELAIGKTPRAAIDSGYAKAFSTIVDANVTTFIAGVVLMQYGSGPVRGFAVTLIAGILCSMFTAIYVTRLIYDFFSSRRRLETLSI
jgi:preprotein translocase subunit SecD